MKSFTLIETLLTITIFIIIIGAVFGFIFMGFRVQSYAFEQATAIDEARRGIETMVKEIREADSGEDGSFPIEIAGDKEFVFYSDIDNDGQTERVRYFLGTVSSGNQIQNCYTTISGGICFNVFSGFLQGTLISAQVKVSVEGDLGASNEYVEIFADGNKLGDLCKTGCTDCAGIWQGTAIYDVTSRASDNSVTFSADASSKVDSNCSWGGSHKMKAQFEFSWTEEITVGEHQFRKGVIEPTGSPATYPLAQEKISVLSSYVRNTPPIFEYFDKNGEKIISYPARLVDTKLMKVFLVVNVDPNRPPQNFELESSARLRNLIND